MTDWRAWHDAYDDPDSTLSRRLRVVRRRLAEALDGQGGRPVRVLSLCAGDGRDVIPVAATRRTDQRVEALLVERDPVLARRAADAARDAGLDGITVREADAARPAVFADFVPADVVVLCGIFGNVVDDDVRTVIAAVPALAVPGGTVIWTRGGSVPDRRPDVRRWFADAGLPALSFDGAPEAFGVGVNRVPGPPEGQPPPPFPDRLFTFVR